MHAAHWVLPTDRIVKAMPLESTLVASWWSILRSGSDMSRSSQEPHNLHVVRKRDLPLLVANDGELQVAARNLVDVLDPAIVAVDGVRGEADELRATLGELGLELREGAELGGADGSVVLRMREEDHPLVADELVEVDWALGGLGLEVWGGAAQTERIRALLRHDVFYAPGQLWRKLRKQRKHEG
jgi:hypothetical protein